MATNFYVPGNNVSTAVGVNGYTAGSNTLLLTAGTGSKFPTLSAGQNYRVTVCQVAFAYSPTASVSNYTIYKATALSTDTLTLVSGSPLEGTSDRNYATGDIVEIRVTAGTLSDIHTAVKSLEYLSTPVTVTTTKALSSTDFGTTQVCSGTSANYTVTLPSPVAGGIIAFRMSPALTKLVTISQYDTSGHADKIDGANTRVMWANEAATLVSDGTNWFKVAGKSIPMQCALYQSSGSVSVPNITGVMMTTFTTVQVDNTGLMGLAGSGKVTIQRPAVYSVTGIISLSGIGGTGMSQFYVCQNGTAIFGSPQFYVSNNNPVSGTATTFPAVAGDYIQAQSFQITGGTLNTTGLNNYNLNSINVLEIVSW